MLCAGSRAARARLHAGGLSSTGPGRVEAGRVDVGRPELLVGPTPHLDDAARSDEEQRGVPVAHGADWIENDHRIRELVSRLEAIGIDRVDAAQRPD
jgi:hypothetical protein